MTTLREHLSRLGRKGGQATAQKLTPEERKESARKAAAARWEKEREQTKALKDNASDLLEKARKRQKKGKESA